MSFRKEIMQQYCKGWYGFDGNGRKVIDKTGFAGFALTCPDNEMPYYNNGWNGRGFSAECFRSSVFSMPNHAMNPNAFTYRFKFKAISGLGHGGTILSNMVNTYSPYFKLGLSSSGNVTLSARLANGNTIIKNSTKKYNDGKWHDIIFACNYMTGTQRMIYSWLIDDTELMQDFVTTSQTFGNNFILHVLGGSANEPFNNVQIDDLILLSAYVQLDKIEFATHRRHFALNLKDPDKFKTINRNNIKYSTGHGKYGLHRIDDATGTLIDHYGVLREIDQAVDAEAIDLQQKAKRLTSTSNRWNIGATDGQYDMLDIPIYRGRLLSVNTSSMSSEIYVALKYKGKFYQPNSINHSTKQIVWIQTGQGQGSPPLGSYNGWYIDDLIGYDFLHQFASQPDFDPLDIVLCIDGGMGGTYPYYQFTFESENDTDGLSFADVAGYQDFELNVYTQDEDATYSVAINNKNLSSQLVMQKDPIQLPVVNDEIRVLSATGLARYGITFDDGATWRTFKNGAFIDVTHPEFGQQLGNLTNISIAQWKEEIAGETGMKFGWWLEDSNSYVSEVIVLGTSDGYEGVANTLKYTINYDEENQNIHVNFKQDGIYKIQYHDTKIPYASPPNN